MHENQKDIIEKFYSTDFKVNNTNIDYYYYPEKKDIPEIINRYIEPMVSILEKNYDKIENTLSELLYFVAEDYDMLPNIERIKSLLSLTNIIVTRDYGYNVFEFIYNNGKYPNKKFFKGESVSILVYVNTDNGTIHIDDKIKI